MLRTLILASALALAGAMDAAAQSDAGGHDRLLLRTAAAAAPIVRPPPPQQLGRSWEGDPIRVWRRGNPRSQRRVLVVGSIHGNEAAGLRVTQWLLNKPLSISIDLWIVDLLNPDGHRRRSRGNARGVDLNRDFLTATQRETRIARTLVMRLRPDVTIWYHQPQALVRAWGPSRALARRYARLAGVPYRSLEWPPGSASRWQNGIGLRSFVVELPPGDLPVAAARRHAQAVLRVAG